MAHKHIVYDTDSHFLIDTITRSIINTTEMKTMLVQHDHNSERFTFEMPRYIDGHDVLLCSEIEIHYNNIDAATHGENKNVYLVDDVKAKTDDDTKAVFSWLVSDNATQYVGKLSFLICFKCTAESVIEYKWHTSINSDISIVSGMNNAEEVTEPFPDILSQWKAELFEAGGNAVVNVNVAETEALEAIQAEGAAQVQAVEEEGTTQLQILQAAAEAVVADREQIHKNNAYKSAVIEGNSEGETILIDDSANQPLIALNVFGRSTQNTTAGANLANFPDSTRTGNGVTGIISNGVVTISGTPDVESGEVFTWFGEDLDLDLLTEGTTYYSNDCSMQVTYDDGSKKWVTTLEYSNAITQIRVYVQKLTTEYTDGLVLYPIVSTIQDAAFEPYTGGIASPNPEYPQEINSIDSPVVKVCGKNLLNQTCASQTIKGVTFAVNNDGGITLNGTSTEALAFEINGKLTGLKRGEQYTISGNPNNSADYMLYFDQKDSLGNNIGSCQDYGSGKSAVLSNDYEYLWVGIFTQANVTFNNITFYPMIRLSAVENETYEQYKEQQTITLPYALHGIPVASGGNYTDADGQQWICDEVDFERGVLVQRCSILKLTGGESWQTYKNSLRDITYAFRLKIDDMYDIEKMGFETETGLKCSHLQYGGYVSTNQVTGIGLSEVQYVYFRFDGENDTITSIDNLNEWIVAKNADGEPVTILYRLAEPIETALTDAEIEAFKALYSNYSTTTILNDSGAKMAVKYGIDTKLYIDKKFAELQQMISSTN